MIKYRNASVADYKKLALIHTQTFEGFFLTTLGFQFLCTYYLSCLKNKKTVAICAYLPNQELIGFASGSILSKGYHKSIVSSNFFRFGIALIKVMCTRPSAILRLLNNLDKTKEVDDKGDYAELLSIAILPSHKGLGIGKQMLLEFETEVGKRNGDKIALTTDYFDNVSVIEFYKKSGYAVFYDFVTYPNRKMIKMIKRLNKL